MAEVRWTPHAADALEAIANYIARDSEHYSSLFVAQIIAAIDRLAAFPEMGRIVPELGEPNIRELLFHSYRIVYRLGEIVEILTIHHGHRNLGLKDLT